MTSEFTVQQLLAEIADSDAREADFRNRAETAETKVGELEAAYADLNTRTLLGNATTGMLLAEISARIQVDYYNGGGGLEYTTTKGRPDGI